MTRSDFRNLLKQLRLDAGLTQTELGEKVGISSSAISRYETGDIVPVPDNLLAIVTALESSGIPEDKLDELWRFHYPAQVPEMKIADPFVMQIRRTREKLGIDEKVLNQELQAAIEILRRFYTAEEAVKQRKWTSADEKLASIRNEKERYDQRWYLRIDELRGVCCHSNAKYQRAIDLFDSALWSALCLEDLHRQARIHVRLGDSHRRLGGRSHWESALDHYEEAETIFQGRGDSVRVADCLRKQTAALVYMAQLDEAERRCRASLGKSESEEYAVGIYKALQHKGWILDHYGQWAEATQLYVDALAIVNDIAPDDDWERSKALFYLGNACRLQRKLDKALESYSEAFQLMERWVENEGDGARLHQSKVRLGIAKVLSKQPGGRLQAMSFLNESLETHQSAGESFLVADTFREQGELLLELGRMRDAEGRIRKAVERFKGLGNDYYYAISLADLCRLCYRKKEYDQLFQVAMIAKSIESDLIDHQISRIELHLGKAYIDQRKDSEALEAFCTATAKALKFNDIVFRDSFDTIRAEVNEIAREISPQAALHLCRAVQDFWKSEQVQPGKHELVAEELDALLRVESEISALVPID